MIVHLFWVNISALLNVKVNFRRPAAAAPVTSDTSICSYWTAADMSCTWGGCVCAQIIYRHRDP